MYFRWSNGWKGQVDICVWTASAVCFWSATYHADLSGHQVTQSVEPVDVGLQVAGFTLPEETLKNKKRETTRSKQT